MLPDPHVRPLLKPAELVGLIPLQRSAIYAAIERGEIPVITYGSRIYVVNAELQRQWGLHAGGTDTERETRTHDSSAGGPPRPPSTLTDRNLTGDSDGPQGTPRSLRTA